jgi:hypothetical protein
MFPHHRFVGSNIDTANFILRDTTLELLNLRPQIRERAAGFLRNRQNRFWLQTCCIGDFTLDHIIGIFPFLSGFDVDSAVAVFCRKILCRRLEIANVYSLRDKPD